MTKYTLDIDKLEQELKDQELFLSEDQWMSLIVSIKRASVEEETVEEAITSEFDETCAKCGWAAWRHTRTHPCPTYVRRKES